MSGSFSFFLYFLLSSRGVSAREINRNSAGSYLPYMRALLSFGNYSRKKKNRTKHLFFLFQAKMKATKQPSNQARTKLDRSID
ncbi:hypothetical protein C8Q69DRAFT_10068 [Paecilomyces variotii]|uniref:Secreted protein n=1 Tax=Byssochlamys spectabilis TaxID=264951 RepID=A0A443I4T5_BYSSP|nr:hypothetical protein C8Q69DRAFT_10068 [Paecilomyces variotii]RWQ99074.1 hypothetical protein C8Q69DRAFT_10068 [Paecilomyces variotii]